MSEEYSLADELDRKVGETLLWVDGEMTRGAMDSKTAHAVLTAFDMTTLGLIDRKFNDWALERRKEALAVKYSDFVVLTKIGQPIYVLQLHRDTGEVSCITMTSLGTSKKRKSYEGTDPIKAAVEAYPGVIEKMLKAGWEIV